jgi:hypothetical protein
VLFCKHYENDQIKVDVLNRACSTHGREAHKKFSEEVKMEGLTSHKHKFLLFYSQHVSAQIGLSSDDS